MVAQLTGLRVPGFINAEPAGVSLGQVTAFAQTLPGSINSHIASGWPFVIWTVSLTNPKADFNTIGDAIDAASDGDTILIDIGTYTESLSAIASAITLMALDREKTIITTTDSPTIGTRANVCLYNLTIENTGDSGGGGILNNTALWVNDNFADDGDIFCYNCRFVNDIDNANGGAAVYIDGTGTGHKFLYCEAEIANADGTSTADYALQTNSSCLVRGGRWDGIHADIYCGAGTVTLDNLPVLVNKLVDGAGTVVGFYQDGSNNVITTGKVAIGTSPDAKLDVAGGHIRALDDGTNVIPTSGSGVELLGYNGNGYVISYDRDAGASIPLYVYGNPTYFQAGDAKSPSYDFMPLGIESGLGARLVNTGITPTWHFTTNSIPTGYAWAGADRKSVV